MRPAPSSASPPTTSCACATRAFRIDWPTSCSIPTHAPPWPPNAVKTPIITSTVIHPTTYTAIPGTVAGGEQTVGTTTNARLCGTDSCRWTNDSQPNDQGLATPLGEPAFFSFDFSSARCSLACLTIESCKSP